MWGGLCWLCSALSRSETGRNWQGVVLFWYTASLLKLHQAAERRLIVEHQIQEDVHSVSVLKLGLSCYLRRILGWSVELNRWVDWCRVCIDSDMDCCSSEVKSHLPPKHLTYSFGVITLPMVRMARHSSHCVRVKLLRMSYLVKPAATMTCTSIHIRKTDG